MGAKGHYILRNKLSTTAHFMTLRGDLVTVGASVLVLGEAVASALAVPGRCRN